MQNYIKLLTKNTPNIVTNTIINPKQILRKPHKKIPNVYVVDSHNTYTHIMLKKKVELGAATSYNSYVFKHKRVKTLKFRSLLPAQDISEIGTSFLDVLLKNGKILSNPKIKKQLIFLGPTRGGYKAMSLGIVGEIKSFEVYQLLQRRVENMVTNIETNSPENLLFLANLHKSNKLFSLRGELENFYFLMSHSLTTLTKKRKPKRKMAKITTYKPTFQFNFIFKINQEYKKEKFENENGKIEQRIILPRIATYCPIKNEKRVNVVQLLVPKDIDYSPYKYNYIILRREKKIKSLVKKETKLLNKFDTIKKKVPLIQSLKARKVKLKLKKQIKTKIKLELKKASSKKISKQQALENSLYTEFNMLARYFITNPQKTE